MTKEQNRTQRREELRKVIKNRKDKVESRASNTRRIARIGRKRDAESTNRERAMRAAGEDPHARSRWPSTSSLREGKGLGLQMLVAVVIVLAIVGVYSGLITYEQGRQGISVGRDVMSYEEGRLSVV